MARKKKRKAAGSSGAEHQRAARDQLLLDDGGYDWGLRSEGVALGNAELARRLAAGDFVGCAYGFLPPDGPPFIGLLGRDLAGMRSALSLMREWVDASGPNALRIEIALDGSGYVIAISHEPQLLRWRLAGLDSVGVPLLLSLAVTKRLDSRHPMLGELAAYARRPVAPIWLTVARLPDGTPEGTSGGHRVQADLKDGLLLPGLAIYPGLDARPRDSLIRTEADVSADRVKRWPPPEDTSPDRVARVREERLSGTLPKTLHVLRTGGLAGRLMQAPELRACAVWQVEQAVCNLRICDFLAYTPNSRAKRLAMIEEARRTLLEPASARVDEADLSPTAVAGQVIRDAAFLLRRVAPGEEPPPSLAETLGRLEALGYG